MTSAAPTTVARHRTAISRGQLSVPLQAAARHGFLDGSKTVFDYGCGRGNDLAILTVAGITATGWDPHFRPDAARSPADLVNLGYVLNVIEHPTERVDALRSAFELARQCMVVSVLTSGEEAAAGSQPWGDGLLSTRGTFQKYFTQAEISELIERALGEEALTVGPGLFFVFRDKLEEQRFLANRHRRRQDISHLLTLAPPTPEERSWQEWTQFDAERELVTAVWERMLELGRLPALSELDLSTRESVTARLRPVRRAARLAQIGFDSAQFHSARVARIEDLRVYFALNLFNRRKPYTQLPQELQGDINAFFGSYSKAKEEGRELLFSLGDPGEILDACRQASDAGLGWLDGTHSLQLHVDLIDRLPATLRSYIGCAEKLYGDVDQADLVKIHIGSGKLTLLKHHDFEKNPLPRLRERVKIKLGEQDVDFFDYQDDPDPPYTYLKSRYMAAGQRGYATQRRFDAKLQRLGLFDFSEFGPSAGQFRLGLAKAGLAMNGRKLERAQ